MYGLFFISFGYLYISDSYIYKENGIQKNGEREKQREKDLKTFSITTNLFLHKSASLKCFFFLYIFYIYKIQKKHILLKLILPFPEGGKNMTLRILFFLSYFLKLFPRLIFLCIFIHIYHFFKMVYI